MNKVIGAYDKNILEFGKGWLRQSYHSDDLKRFEKSAKDIDVLFIVDSNPAFTLPRSWKFKELLKKVKTVVSIQSFPCETDEFADYAPKLMEGLGCSFDEKLAARPLFSKAVTANARRVFAAEHNTAKSL